MVKKLFKHEFLAWLQIMTILYAVMLTFSAAFRIFLCFENDSVGYEVISVLGVIIFILFLSICLAFCTIFGVVRFYKNMFTGEGYLTLTLPVTAAQHIWVKALTAGAMSMLTLVVAIASAMIVMSGDMLTEVFKAAAYIFDQIPAEYAGHIPGYCAEILLITIASSVFTPMLYYACICIGQLFRKHRVLAAVGVYFGYYYLCQFLLSLVAGAFAVAGMAAPEEILTESMKVSTAQILGSYHSVLCTGLLWTVGVGMIYFVISHHILSKKLNLE